MEYLFTLSSSCWMREENVTIVTFTFQKLYRWILWRSLSGRSQWTKKTIESIECLTCVIKNLAVLSTILTIRDYTSWLFVYPCMPRLLANLCNPTNLGEFFFLPLSPYLFSCSHFAKINIPIYIHTSSHTYAHYRPCCELLSQTASLLALRNSERNNKK